MSDDHESQMSSTLTCAVCGAPIVRESHDFPTCRDWHVQSQNGVRTPEQQRAMDEYLYAAGMYGKALEAMPGWLIWQADTLASWDLTQWEQLEAPIEHADALIERLVDEEERENRQWATQPQ